MAQELSGIAVVVTRTERQAAPLVAALTALGARPVCCPTIRIDPPADPAALDAAARSLATYDWAVFTSANGVERFFARAGGSAPLPDRPRVAAIGPATAAALEARGARVDVVPREYVAEALVGALASAGPLAGARVLIARAAVGRDVLPDALREAGAFVDLVEVYRTSLPEESRGPLCAAVDGGARIAVCTSPSTARNFVELAGPERAARVAFVCTGPVTAAAARELGLDVAAALPAYTVGGVLEAVTRAAVDPR